MHWLRATMCLFLHRELCVSYTEETKEEGFGRTLPRKEEVAQGRCLSAMDKLIYVCLQFLAFTLFPELFLLHGQSNFEIDENYLYI